MSIQTHTHHSTKFIYLLTLLAFVFIYGLVCTQVPQKLLLTFVHTDLCTLVLQIFIYLLLVFVFTIACLCFYRLTHTQVPQRILLLLLTFLFTDLSMPVHKFYLLSLLFASLCLYGKHIAHLCLYRLAHTSPQNLFIIIIAQLCLYRLLHTSHTNFYFILFYSPYLYRIVHTCPTKNIYIIYYIIIILLLLAFVFNMIDLNTSPSKSISRLNHDAHQSTLQVNLHISVSDHIVDCNDINTPCRK